VVVNTRDGHPEIGDEVKVPGKADEFPLSDTPERFLDREEWDGFVAGCGSREAALAKLSSKGGDGLLAFMRLQAAELPGEAGARARVELASDEQGKRIVGRLKSLLASGELVATALQPPVLERVRVPAELWPDLQLDFLTDEAAGAGYVFRAVRVSTSTTFDLVERCAAFLERRRAEHGDELKKVLEAAARSELGDALTDRRFDQAYAAVYRRGRGRPRGGAG
jgi:hypothetical protein